MSVASRPEWTPAQRTAIEHVDGALLLSAAAGSGKTAVLANRCVHLVCDAPEPCDVDELLVLTFTRAAAAEMRERIDRELRRRVGEATVPDERLERQLRLIDRAAITTIDAFCADLVRSHFNLANVDPAFTTLAPEDAGLLKDDVCDAMLEAAYDERDARAFKALLDGYFNGDDAGLRSEIINAYNVLQSVIDPDAWTRDALARLDAGTRNEPGAMARELVAVIARHLRVAKRQLDMAADAARREAKLSPYANHAVELATELGERLTLVEAFDFDALADRTEQFTVPRMPTIRGEVPGKEAVKRRIDAVKDTMKKGPIRGYGRWRWDDLRRDLAQVRASAETFFGFVDRFGERYARAKRGIRSLDFAEIERLALTILRDAYEPDRPSAAATEVQRRFRHVLVDEFQDINPMQSAILALASRDRAAELTSDRVRSNLFSVGDVKQSIYGFRLAEPLLFVKRDKALRHADPRRGRVIDLQHNFRSRAPLLDAINDVFANLMTEASADVAYDDTQALRAGADYPAFEGGPSFTGKPIELRLVSDEPPEHDEASDDEEGNERVGADRFDREVTVVARRIRELVCADASKRPLVLGRATEGGLAPRPIRYADVAVLLRSARFKSSVVADALRARGIPVHADDTTGFFAATEVQDILSLLRLLSNGRQDVPLAAVLRSPLARITNADAALARIRIAYPEEPFHRAAARYAVEAAGPLADQLARFFRVLAGWRGFVQEHSIVETLTRVIRDTGYRTFCRAMRGGEQRVANLEELLGRAAAFDTFERQGLDRFLRFLRELEAEDALGRPPIATGSDDVVRVMTVHKSKGLEFPVVIVPDLGKRFNEQSLARPVLIDRDAGIGMNAVDLRKRIRYPSASSAIVREHARRRMLAEEIRVLYVALTRAREHLILIGTGTQADVDAWRDEWAGHAGPLPDDFIQEARTTLDWVGPIAALTADRRSGTFDVTVESAGGEVEQEQENEAGCAPPATGERLQQWLNESLAAVDSGAAPADGATAAANRLTFVYPHLGAAHQAATAAVTSEKVKAAAAMPATDRAVARRDRLEPDERRAVGELDWPEAYRPRAGTRRATDVGTAVHRLLESLDFSRPIDTPLDLAAQLAFLVDRRAIKAEEAALVDLDAIRWFAGTRLGRAIRDGSAGRLVREQPLALAGNLPDAAGPGDFVLVRGRVDAMLVGGHGITLVDYKTDRVQGDGVLARAAIYAPQLSAYAGALVRITGRPVVGAFAVFLRARQIVSIDPATRQPQIAEAFS